MILVVVYLLWMGHHWAHKPRITLKGQLSHNPHLDENTNPQIK